MTRDDFPYSLQPYATPDSGGDGVQESDAWTLVLFRAADEAERLWFRDHGFVMEGRRWVRHARPLDSPAEGPDCDDKAEDEKPGDQEPDDRELPTGGPAPDVTT